MPTRKAFFGSYGGPGQGCFSQTRLWVPLLTSGGKRHPRLLPHRPGEKAAPLWCRLQRPLAPCRNAGLPLSLEAGGMQAGFQPPRSTERVFWSWSSPRGLLLLALPQDWLPGQSPPRHLSGTARAEPLGLSPGRGAGTGQAPGLRGWAPQRRSPGAGPCSASVPPPHPGGQDWPPCRKGGLPLGREGALPGRGPNSPPPLPSAF